MHFVILSYCHTFFLLNSLFLSAYLFVRLLIHFLFLCLYFCRFTYLSCSSLQWTVCPCFLLSPYSFYLFYLLFLNISYSLSVFFIIFISLYQFKTVCINNLSLIAAFLPKNLPFEIPALSFVLFIFTAFVRLPFSLFQHLGFS